MMQASTVNETQSVRAVDGGVDAVIPPALYLMLLLAMVAPSLTFVTLPPSLPLIADYFGAGPNGQTIAKAAQALTFLGSAVGGLVAGALISRGGLRATLLVSASVYALGGLLAMLAYVPAMLFVGSAAVGVVAAILSSALAMATGAELLGERRAKMLGYQAAVSDVTGIVIGIAAGVLAQFVGWRGPLAVYVGFGVAMLMLVIRARPRAAEDGAAGARGGMLTVIKAAWPVYAASLLLSVLLGTQQIQLPFHLAAHGISAAGSRALVQTSSTIAAACASLTFGWTQARLGDRFMLVLAGIAGAVGFAGYATWQSGLGPVCAAAACVGGAVGIGIPMLFVFALRSTRPPLHGYAIGILNTSLALGGALSPVLFGPLAAGRGLPAVFACCAALALLGGIAIAISLRGRTRDRRSAA